MKNLLINKIQNLELASFFINIIFEWNRKKTIVYKKGLFGFFQLYEVLLIISYRI